MEALAMPGTTDDAPLTWTEDLCRTLEELSAELSRLEAALRASEERRRERAAAALQWLAAAAETM